jgi:sugar O-acyltransferase (sialic acid O-acetyltransferase NeuD family)
MQNNSKCTSVLVEKLNPSDEKYKVVEISVSNNSFVNKGQNLFTVETSKASFEIEAEVDGYFFHNITLESFVYPNEEVGVISNDASYNFKSKVTESIALDKNKEQVITLPASKLIKENSIDIEVFAHLNIIKEIDVLNHIKQKPKPKPILKPNYLKNDLILIGGLGTAAMLIDAIKSTNSFKIKGILDNSLAKNDEVMGVKVLGGDELLDDFYSEGYRNLAISFTSLGALHERMYKCVELQNRGFLFPNIFHKDASVEPSSQFGQGNIVLANALVGSSVIMGNFNFINTAAIISHECDIKNNNHFAPGSILAGRLKIGNNNLFGMGCTLYHDLCIGDNNVVFNGVNVFKDIKDNEKLS